MAEIEIFNPVDLAAAITSMKTPCTFNKYEIAPSNVLYHFDLNNPLDYTKINKMAKCLTALIHKPVKAGASEVASFCLSIPREERDFPKFKNLHTALAGKKAGEMLFGVDEHGNTITRNITKTKSMLVAGASGGGKSVYLSSLICSLISYSKPQECGLVLIDLKRCEFELFKNAPHLVCPVQFEYDGAHRTLEAVKSEIERRYKDMQANGIRTATVDKYPLLIVFIDEYAELALRGDKNELDKIVSSIAATGRAANVFIVVSTQHAVSTIISNVIKSNLQSRVGLRTTNIAQSSCILNCRDCVDLLGYGDSYVSFDGVAGLLRVQGAYIDENDINTMLKAQNEAASINHSTIELDGSKNGNTTQKTKWWQKLFGKHKAFADKELNYIDCCIDDDINT